MVPGTTDGSVVLQVGGFRAFGIGLAYLSLDSYREELYAGVPEQSTADAGDAAGALCQLLMMGQGDAVCADRHKSRPSLAGSS